MPSLNYTTIHHETRKSLGLTANEYMVADLIYNLQNNQNSKCPGWCYASKEIIGTMLGMSSRGITKIIGRLIKDKLIIKNPTTKYLKSSQEWYEKVVYINQNDEQGTTFPRNREQRSLAIGNNVPKNPDTNNNIDNNIDNIPHANPLSCDKGKPRPAPVSNTIGYNDILEHFVTCSGDKVRMTDKKREQIRARLKMFTMDEIKKAISNTYEDRFYSGNNDRKWKADFTYIFRNDDNMEKLINMKPRRENARIFVQK